MLRRTAIAGASVFACLALLPAHAAPARPSASVLNQGPTLRGLEIQSAYDGMRVPDAAALNPRQALTVELWVKRLRFSGCGPLVSKGREAAYALDLCDGRLRFSIAGQSVDGSASLPEGRWTHVAATYASGQVALYIQGTLDRAAALQAALPATNRNDLALGTDPVAGGFILCRLDHARLWSVARSASDIRDNMTAILPPEAGLVAQWTLDGDGRDGVDTHDGRPGSGNFGPDGVLPRDPVVPVTAQGVTVDGRCDPAEYGVAERVVLEGLDGSLAYLQATAEQLYVCAPELPKASSAGLALAVMLDRNLSRDARAQPGDYRVLVKPTTNAVVEEGDGLGGWKVVTLVAGTWEGKAVATTDRWSAEVRFSRSLIEPPRDPDQPVAAGLAVGNLAVRAAGDDWFWPPAAAGAVPSSWAVATFADGPRPSLSVSLQGRVLRSEPDGDPTGAGGAVVQLWVDRDDRLSLADATTTDGSGRWALVYDGPRPETVVVRELDPAGMVSVLASAPSPGIASGANVLSWRIDPEDPTQDLSVEDVSFVDELTPVDPAPLGRHLLIVYAAPVTEADLWQLILTRRAQGFLVTARSTEELGRTEPGRDLAERIHNWFQRVWREHEEDGEPVYALLVGRGDAVPFRDVGWLGTDHRDPALPNYYPAWPTDWYYADLDSDWDSDGDGYFGEFLGCPPGTTYPDGDEDVDCPEEGSLIREGPFGERRGVEDDFQPEIAVGRLAMNEPAEVRAALAASARADGDTGPEKGRALVAGAMWHYKGQTYVDEGHATVDGGQPKADAWLRARWDGTSPFGLDAGEALESLLVPQLRAVVGETRRLYETTAPGDDASLSPSRLTPDAPLSEANFNEAWRRGVGFAALAGRGAADGIYGARWLRDWDADRRIDQPASPIYCDRQQVTPDQLGPPCNELQAERFATAGLAATSGAPAVVVADAGDTAAVAWSWDGADAAGNIRRLRFGPPTLVGPLAASGAVAGWLGSLTPQEPGALDGYQAALADAFVAQGLALGDAQNRSMAELARGKPYDLRSYAMTLFGDPALGYWAARPDGRGAWPEDGGGPAGSGGSAYNGPAVPELAWVARDTQPASPVAIGADGEPVLGGTGRVARISPAGALVAQGSLGSPGTAVRYPPALGDNSVWVAAGSTVYVLGTTLQARYTIALPDGASATGSPRLAPDGSAYIPTSQGLAGSLPSGGVRWITRVGVRGTPALRSDGELVWSDESGRVVGYRLAQDGTATLRNLNSTDLGDLTAPSVSRLGTVYVGAENGRVYALPSDGVGWQLEAGGAVRQRPAVARDGQVFVANARGQLLAFAAESRELLWRAELGAAAAASPSVDAAQVYVAVGSALLALDRATGRRLWDIDLGGATDSRSSPVLGADRTLYVTRADQALVALREAGWLAAPSNITIEPTALGAIVRWRDNSAEEVGFRVTACTPFDPRCYVLGTAPAGASRLDVAQLPGTSGTPFTVAVQALGRGAAGCSPLDPRCYAPERSTAAVRRPGHDRDAARSRPLSPDAVTGSDLIHSAPWAALGVAPSAVVALSAHGTASDAIALSWRYEGDRGRLTGFRVMRRGTQGLEWAAELGADAEGFVDTSLQSDRGYSYEVTAHGPGGDASLAQATATTWRQMLRAPTGLTATVQRTGLLLQWRDTNTTEEAHLVERLDPGTARYRPIGQLGANAVRFMDTYYLVPGTYTYRVRAIGESVDSPYSFVTVRYAHEAGRPIFLPIMYQTRPR